MKIEIKHKGSCLGAMGVADGGSSATPWRKAIPSLSWFARRPAPGISPGGSLLFHLIGKLYERSSLIITTSYGPSSRRQQPIKPA
jgi:hypothetical protein